MLGAYLTAAALLILLFKGENTLHEALFPRFYQRADFPDDWFLPMKDPAFAARALQGFAAMKRRKAVLCALTQNNEQVLPLSLARLERTGRCFSGHHIVVFENGSTDRTLEILQGFAASNPRATVISSSLKGHPMQRAPRTVRLAHLRNRLLEHVRQTPELRDFDNLIMADMDLAGGWSLTGLAWGFAASGWDGLVSNSLGHHFMRRTYYDVFALEPKSVLNHNLFYRLIGEAWQFRPGSPLIPVRSGFGGLGVYRMEAVLPRVYSGVLHGLEVCEHSGLNQDGGLRLFLNPAQITLTGSQGWEDGRNSLSGRLRRILRNW